jgi:hypothetical protein
MFKCIKEYEKLKIIIKTNKVHIKHFIFKRLLYFMIERAQLLMMYFTAYFSSSFFSIFVALILSIPSYFTKKSTSLSLTFLYLNFKRLITGLFGIMILANLQCVLTTFISLFPQNPNS